MLSFQIVDPCNIVWTDRERRIKVIRVTRGFKTSFEREVGRGVDKNFMEIQQAKFISYFTKEEEEEIKLEISRTPRYRVFFFLPFFLPFFLFLTSKRAVYVNDYDRVVSCRI